MVKIVIIYFNFLIKASYLFYFCVFISDETFIKILLKSFTIIMRIDPTAGGELAEGGKILMICSIRSLIYKFIF